MRNCYVTPEAGDPLGTRGRKEPAAQMLSSKGEDVSMVYVTPEVGRNTVSAKIKRIGSHRSLLRENPVFFRFKGFATAEGRFASILC